MNKEKENGNHDQWRPDEPVSAQSPPGLINEALVNLANQIARRAYFLYLEDGARHGHDRAHWLQAEAELFRERADRRAEQRPSIADAGRQAGRQGTGLIL